MKNMNRNDRNGERRNNRQGESSKPFARRGEKRKAESSKPFADRSEHRQGEPSKPFADRGEFRKGGSSKPFAKSEHRRGKAPRPFARSEDRHSDSSRPSIKREQRQNKSPKPFSSRPFAKREGRPDRERPAPQTAYVPREGIMLWGFHAVREAWLNPKRRCFRLWCNESAAASFEATINTAKNDLLLKRPDLKKVERIELDRLTPPGSVHQGIVLEVSTLTEPSLSDIIAAESPPDLLIVLDQVTDPHNVGAIMRSAAALGAGAVILTERNAPATTGVLAKSASGALEHVPQIHVVNLSRAMDDLKQAGYWCVGLAEEGEKDLSNIDLSGRTALILGAEGDGLRQLTRKKCDELAHLPTGGAISSLNVSNAAAVALYEARRQKRKAG